MNGSKRSAAREGVEHASVGSGRRPQCSREAVLKVAYIFCLRPLFRSSICCSGCGKKFHTETLCMDIKEKILSILLEDKVGAVNFLVVNVE